MAYANHFKPYGAEAADVRITQPSRREIEFDSQLARIDRQPPGSWHWMNMPVNGEARDAERQKYAYGGYSVVRMVQEPTRLPRQDAMAVVPAALDSLVDVVPSVIESLACSPTSAQTGVEISCSSSATPGTDPVQEFVFDWGDGTSDFIGSASNRASASHVYSFPGTYTVRTRAYDAYGRASAVVERQIVIQPSPPMITAICSPSEVKPNQPDGSGEPTACSISAIAGSHSLKEYRISWGDGSSSTTAASGSSWDATHIYQNEGTYTVEMFAVDSAGLESNRVTTNVRARHLPPRIVSWTCFPVVVTPKDATTCSVVVEKGTTDATMLQVDWGDGNTPSATLYGTTTTVSHTYSSVTTDNTFSVVAVARDQAGLSSEPAVFDVVVRIGRPESEVWCSETTIYEGDTVTCEVRTITEGTFPVRTYYFDWGDGSGVTTRTSSVSPSTQSATHTYNTRGDVFFRGWVADTLGNTGDVDSLAIKILPYSPPVADSLRCDDNRILFDGDVVTCTLYGRQGTFPFESFVFDWGAGSPEVLTAVSGETKKTASRGFGVGTHTITAWIVDRQRGAISNQLTTTFTVEPRIPPAVTLTCDRTSLNAKETTTCRINATLSPPAVVDTIAYDNGNGNLVKVAATSLPFDFSVTSSVAADLTVRARARGSHGVWSNIVTETVRFVFIRPSIISASCPSSVNANVELTCSVSADGGTDGIAKYVVDWGNGVTDVTYTTATSTNLTYTYPPTTPGGSKAVRIRACTSGDVCSDEVSRSINVNAVPATATISVGQTYVRQNGSASLTISYNGGGAPVTSVYYAITSPSGSIVASGWKYPNKASGSFSVAAVTGSVGTYKVNATAYTAVSTGSAPQKKYTVVSPVIATVTDMADIPPGGSWDLTGQAALSAGGGHKVSVTLKNETTNTVLCSASGSGIAQCTKRTSFTTPEQSITISARAEGATGNGQLNDAIGLDLKRDRFYVYTPPTADVDFLTKGKSTGVATGKNIKAYNDRTVVKLEWDVVYGTVVSGQGTSRADISFLPYCLIPPNPMGAEAVVWATIYLNVYDSRGYRGYGRTDVPLYSCTR